MAGWRLSVECPHRVRCAHAENPTKNAFNGPRYGCGHANVQMAQCACREKVYPVTRREAGRGRATGGARGQGTSEARDAPGGGRAGPRRRRGADSADTADTYRQRGHGRRGAGCHLPAHASRAKQQAHLGPPSARPSSVAHSTFRHAQPPATAALSCAAGPPLPPFTSLARMRFSTRP